MQSLWVYKAFLFSITNLLFGCLQSAFIHCRDNSFAAWLPTLPTMLCQPYISHHVLATFSVLAKQNNDLFLKNLEHLVPNVLGE